ncbi:hypothetical protein OG895_27430 [Streptomyces sp. NBC_00201]|uniref:hypothetical protein n=1 Tax=unclassified Streptomyces TaxID=2593676 RepID=UPI0022538053|nr:MULTISPECIES: hypothetical protein [unclassified Streptomyces]MCX5061377.1 hypothetical protein [Streptomyces sp. NBC_00452]MCX5248909.1 hypothetical protein [Streptomyces sp. NBC_00201]
MSTPPPPQGPYGPPQNPYDRQSPPQGPLAPGPYGQPPAQPYGQAPVPPYGQPYPQQPFPQQPFPQQPYGWGPPPKKRRVGLVLGIVGGVVGVIVAVLVGLAMLGSKVESGFPDADFALTLPRTLLDGRYELTEDLSDTQGQKIEEEMDGAWDAKVTDAKVGQYSLSGGDAKGELVISGMYGRFQHVDKGRDSMLKGVAETDGMTVAVPPKDFRPGGSGITVTCEVVTQKQLGSTLTYPVCAWADGNTAAVVAEVTAKTITQSPSDVDLEAAADTTRQVRSETVRAIH